MIAVFDSGYGGLTVLKPIMELLPEYDYIYLGDNARVPYGSHSQENIANFSEQAVKYLFDRGVTLIIFACNTASSAALRKMQQKFLNGKEEKERKILGVLIPAAEEAAKITKNKRVAVVGTKATINACSYQREIKKIVSEIEVIQKACPLLVPLIEENWHNRPEAISILKKYLRPLKSQHPDTLILGCTHYPFMLTHFKRIMGKKVKVLTSGEIAAKSLKDYLQRHPEIEKKIARNQSREFLTTDDPIAFKEFIEKNMGMKISTPKKIVL